MILKKNLSPLLLFLLLLSSPARSRGGPDDWGETHSEQILWLAEIYNIEDDSLSLMHVFNREIEPESVSWIAPGQIRNKKYSSHRSKWSLTCRVSHTNRIQTRWWSPPSRGFQTRRSRQSKDVLSLLCRSVPGVSSPPSPHCPGPPRYHCRQNLNIDIDHWFIDQLYIKNK